MELYPAIDLRNGRCVRLIQGNYDRETKYDGDPVEVALSFADAGAGWIHVVDLDGARSGQASNRDVVGAIAAGVSPVRVQVGGGVRDEAAALALFDQGVARVVLGTTAVQDPELVFALAGRHPIAVGIDARDGIAAVAGWTHSGTVSVADLLARYRDGGVDAVIVTDIGRDGMLSGPDLDGLETCLAATDTTVIASGGVARLEDLANLARLESGGHRLGGAIVGKAIHEKLFSVEEAVAACAPSA